MGILYNSHLCVHRQMHTGAKRGRQRGGGESGAPIKKYIWCGFAWAWLICAMPLVVGILFHSGTKICWWALRLLVVNDRTHIPVTLRFVSFLLWLDVCFYKDRGGWIIIVFWSFGELCNQGRISGWFGSRKLMIVPYIWRQSNAFGYYCTVENWYYWACVVVCVTFWNVRV